MSSKTTTIQVRIDEDLKKKAVKVLGQMQITMSQAIKMFLAQVVRQDGIGIEFRTPSKRVRKAMDEADANIGMHEVSSVGELFEELER